MQFKWKKLLAASITCMVLTGVSATTMAAYSLSEEVKAPTPALLQASQIGVRTYTTTDPALLAQPDKDAILVMSFGTTFPDTRAKTIEATVNEIKAAHPGTKVVLAFTSHISQRRPYGADAGTGFGTAESGRLQPRCAYFA